MIKKWLLWRDVDVPYRFLPVVLRPQPNTTSTVSSGYMSVNVTSLQAPAQIGSNTPKQGNKFVVFNATVTNVNAKDRQVHATFFALHD